VYKKSLSILRRTFWDIDLGLWYLFEIFVFGFLKKEKPARGEAGRFLGGKR
jgi:hypothetical protein